MLLSTVITTPERLAYMPLLSAPVGFVLYVMHTSTANAKPLTKIIAKMAIPMLFFFIRNLQKNYDALNIELV